MKNTTALKLIACLIIPILQGCGGGGGGGGSSASLPGTYKGTFFVTNNTCENAASDSFEAVLVINQDEARILLDETSLTDGGAKFTYAGQSIDSVTEVVLSQQDSGDCVYSNGAVSNYDWTTFRTITFPSNDGSQLTVLRTKKMSGCNGRYDCTAQWQGQFTKVD